MMKDGNALQEENGQTDIQLKSAKIGKKGQGAIQGWSAQDGTGTHRLYEDSVEDALDETAERDGVCREVSSEMSTSAGNVDTYIQKGKNGLVIDYKTHDMTNWTVADANRYAQEHGQQVQGYMTAISQDGADYSVPSDKLAGYIVAVNKLPQEEKALQAYQDVLNSFGVQFVSSDGDAKSVTQTVTKLAKKHKVF